MPTDYHFLILYEVLDTFIEIRNDSYDDELWSVFGGVRIRDIDFELIVDRYFWDLDFLMTPDEVNEMTPEAKQLMRFSDELFGVVNRLRPHDEELVMPECDPMPTEGVVLFKDGEDYPYLEGG